MNKQRLNNWIRSKRWVILDAENKVVPVEFEEERLKKIKPIQIGLGKRRELEKDQEQQDLWEPCNFISKLFRKFIKDLDEKDY